MLKWLFTLAIAIGTAAAQDVLAPVTPFVPKTQESQPPPSTALLKVASAENALELGFSSAAASLYQKLLDAAPNNRAFHNQVVLGLTRALLDLGQTGDADVALKKFTPPYTADYHVHAGLIAAYLKRWDAAQAEATAANPEELGPAERGWWLFLKGWISTNSAKVAAVSRETNRSDQLYKQAAQLFDQATEAAISNPLALSNSQRARFMLARQYIRLVRDGPQSDERIKDLRQIVERYPGNAAGYEAVSELAVALQTRNGGAADAITLLRSQVDLLPRERRQAGDEWLLLLGLIAGPEDNVGRNALRQLLTSGVDTEKLRAALQLLARNSATVARHDDFRARLDDLIKGPARHPILEDLLLFRAQMALTDKTYSVAEADAERILNDFPGSQLRAAAFGILTSVSWENGSYLNAANNATKAREALEAHDPSHRPGELHAQLGVLKAEAYFRHQDFRTAADAYTSALNEVPPGVSPGDLMFQRELSEIYAGVREGAAGSLDQAEAVLNELSRDRRFDLENRWRAEWNLARALQNVGQIDKAYARVNRLLESPANAVGLPGDLKARMAWLQARLSLDVGEPQKTLALTDTLLKSLDGLDRPTKADIESTTLLLQIRATNALNKPDHEKEAAEYSRRLRKDFPDSPAAVYSYILDAEQAAQKNNLVEAQRLLTKIADDYPENAYAPFARYQAAQYAERRAEPEYYKQAYTLLETLYNKYPESDLRFYARLKAAQLLCKLDDYKAAEQMYGEIIKTFPQHREISKAQLAFADCLAAEVPNDVSKQQSAETLYEQLFDSTTASVDLRAEAGYKYGLNLSNRGNFAAARDAWWETIGDFLLDDVKAPLLGAKGRYWIARTLVFYGQLMEAQGKLDEAGKAYDLLLKKGLTDPSIAQDRLTRIRPVASAIVKP